MLNHQTDVVIPLFAHLPLGLIVPSKGQFLMRAADSGVNLVHLPQVMSLKGITCTGA